MLLTKLFSGSVWDVVFTLEEDLVLAAYGDGHIKVRMIRRLTRTSQRGAVSGHAGDVAGCVRLLPAELLSDSALLILRWVGRRSDRGYLNAGGLLLSMRHVVSKDMSIR